MPNEGDTQELYAQAFGYAPTKAPEVTAIHVQPVWRSFLEFDHDEPYDHRSPKRRRKK